MSTKIFWLMIALLFVAISGKSYMVGDELVLVLAAMCAVCSVVHAFSRRSEKITLRKLMGLVRPPK